MNFRKLLNSLASFELLLEDVLLGVLSVFAIILAISAIAIMSTQSPAVLTERVGALGTVMQLGFLVKAEYIAALMTPWFAMIIGLLIAKELWLIRRRFEGVHFEMVMTRVGSAKTTKKRKR